METKNSNAAPEEGVCIRRAMGIALAALCLGGCATRPLLPMAPADISGGAATANPANPEPDPSVAAAARIGRAERAAPDAGPAAISAGTLLFVRTALDMIGQPYHRGGNAPGGFDCSGLVVYAARRAGLDLPRTAREQQDTGLPVARAELQAGDLVFLRLRKRERHVGIMVDATHFIHAPSSGRRVRVDSLDAIAYSSRVLAMRRPIFRR